MKATIPRAEPTFGDVFKARIDKIETDAKAIGLNFTSICAEAGISRATPDRWKRNSPKTIRLVERMEEIVERERAKRAAEKTAVHH